MRVTAILLVFWVGLPAISGEVCEVPLAFRGEIFSINGQATRLGAAQWSAPEKNWMTVGELLKTTLPPADAAGHRPDVQLVVALDAQAPWGGLKSVLMAATALGVSSISVKCEGASAVPLAVPGVEAQGEVVELPLFAGQKVAQTENGGQRVNCTPGLVKGLVGQLPQATVRVTAEAAVPAVQVVGVLLALHESKAAGVAYLPLKEITAAEAANRKESKDAVDRAFGGLNRALGGRKE